MFTWVKRALAALGLAAVTAGSTPAGHLVRIDAKTDLGKIVLPAGESGAYLLRNSTVLGRINSSTGADGAAGDLARLKLAPELARLDGKMRAASGRLYRYDAIPSDLIGKGIVAPRVVPPGSLSRLQNQYNRIVRGDVDETKPVHLSTQDLKALGLRNGWEFKFLGANTYSLRDLNTGNGFVIWGDPHIDTLTSGGRGCHYGDWTSDCVLFTLPGREADFPTLVVGWSTGGDARNGFGLPTNLLILDRESWTWIGGLNTASPSGVTADGALFAHEAHASDVRRAHPLNWNGTELRTPTGERPAPPPHARDYARSAPAPRVEPHVLYGPNYTLTRGAADGSDLPAQDREMFERYRHAKSAAAAKHPAVSPAAERFATAIVSYAGKQGDYYADRAALVKELDDLRKRLERLYEVIQNPLTKPSDKAEAVKQIDELNKEIDALMARFDKLDGKTK